VLQLATTLMKFSTPVLLRANSSGGGHGGHHGVAAPAARLLDARVGRAMVDLGSGRVVVSETEAPSLPAGLAWSGWAVAQRNNATEPEADHRIALAKRGHAGR
jgi:hypothetical protein